MISHLNLRLAAAALTLGAMFQPRACHAQAAPSATAARLPHISVTAMGSGSPVVLIPGLSSPRAVWDGIAPELARTHRVILVQVNGFGGDAPGANLVPGVLDGVVADLRAYLSVQKIARVDVIGHSMGGLVALMLAKAHPESVRRVMVVDSLPFVGDLFMPNATVAALRPQAAAMRDTMAAGYGRSPDASETLATATRLAMKPTSRTALVAWIGKADPRVSAEALYEDMTTDLRADMTHIATPITLVYPWSAALPEARASALYHAAYAGTPHVAFVPIADSAHFVMLDQPAAFTAAVADFLKGDSR